MSNDELRTRLMEAIDTTLAMPFLVRGENRRLLNAVRSYLPSFPDTELTKLQQHLTPSAKPEKEAT